LFAVLIAGNQYFRKTLNRWPMRAVILTTDTTHHLYFARQLAMQFQVVGIYLETSPFAPTFSVHHTFEDDRERFERDTLLASATESFDAFAPVFRVSTMNHPDAVSNLQRLQTDVALVFGTGLLRTPVIELPKLACLNLHGGNPEAYRGLDSHLWSVYHRDFDNLVTTLHHVARDFDAGDIVLSQKLVVPRGCELYQLRAINTKTCVDLSVAALTVLEKCGRIPSRPQLTRGRYYSAMPGALKERCVSEFQRYAAGL